MDGICHIAWIKVASVPYELSPSFLQLDSRVLDNITTLAVFTNPGFVVEILLALMCMLSHELVIP